MYKINLRNVIILLLLFVVVIVVFYVWISTREPSSYDGEQKDIIKTTISIDKKTRNNGFDCQDIASITNSGDWSLAEAVLVDQTGTSTINSSYILKKSSARSYDVVYGMGDNFNENELKNIGIPDNIINELKSNIEESGAISEDD